MATRLDSKLNQLQQELPEGLLVDAAWLEANGYSSALRSQYVSSGWLDSPARRVYRRSRAYDLAGRDSLQTMLVLPQTVGGRTALEQQGYARPFGGVPEVHLYGRTRQPGWMICRST